MKIIQISDLHLNSLTDITALTNKIDAIHLSINNKFSDSEKIYIFTCGDIIDRSSIEGYEKACVLYDYIKTKFNNYIINFEFVPGNHDLVGDSLDKFDEFIEKYKNTISCQFSTQNVILKKHENINFILVNSVHHLNYKYGFVDLTILRQTLESCDGEIVIVTHHTLMSKYSDDSSSIRNSYEFVELITKYNVIALLHGHTHGYSNILIGKNCRIIGIGPLFKNIEDIPNQFNIIEIVASNIDTIDNYSYRKDTNDFYSRKLYQNIGNWLYHDNSVKKLYNIVVANTKAYGCLNNFRMHIEQSYTEFKEEIELNFPEQIEIAKQWQESKCPPTLYYNHGMLMDKGEIGGLDYIVKELNNKNTSSRAIIPLINIEDVKGSGNDFLPSLDIIQFGFNNELKEKLYITIYLRALEVNHFLKINLCEIYVMVDYIKRKFGSINYLDINILSFRAQYKEKFGCFARAKIDNLDPMDIHELLLEKNIEKIVDLLKNKISLSETVIVNTGVNNLYTSIGKCMERHQDYYSNDIYQSIEHIRKLYIKLEQITHSTSIYSEIKKYEDLIFLGMKETIKLFNKMLIG